MPLASERASKRLSRQLPSAFCRQEVQLKQRQWLALVTSREHTPAPMSHNDENNRYLWELLNNGLDKRVFGVQTYVGGGFSI